MLLFLMLVVVAPCQARKLQFRSYQDLVEMSDLVAIIEPVSTEKAADPYTSERFGAEKKDFQGYNSTFRVQVVLVGDKGIGPDIKVLHFSYASDVRNNHGTRFMSFLPGPQELRKRIVRNGDEKETVKLLQEKPSWLAFLRKREDGRYEPVTPPYDAVDSFREVYDASFLAFSNDKNEEPALITGIFRTIPSMWGVVDPDRGSRRVLHGGVKPADPSLFANLGEVLDAKPYFESQGIEFPKGAEAYGFENGTLLYVRNTAANMEAIEALLGGCGFGDPLVLRHEISVVRFSVPDAFPLTPLPTYAALREAAGSSWQKVCSLEILSKTGQFASAATLSNEGEATVDKGGARPRAPAIKLGQSGASCEIESILGPDGYMIDSSISFRYQGEAEKKPLKILYEGSSTFYDGHPQVLQCFEDAQSGETYAVVMRVMSAFLDTRPRRDSQAGN